MDDALIGYWSDEAVYQGLMEATDIAFRVPNCPNPAESRGPADRQDEQTCGSAESQTHPSGATQQDERCREFNRKDQRNRC